MTNAWRLPLDHIAPSPIAVNATSGDAVSKPAMKVHVRFMSTLPGFSSTGAAPTPSQRNSDLPILSS